VVGVLFAFTLSCKQKKDSEKSKTEQTKQKQETIKERPLIIKELLKFVDTTLSVGSDVNQIFVFKEIDANGTVEIIDTDRAVTLYRELVKRKEVISLPIFELKDTDTAILLVRSKGFGGTIWAKVWVDNETLEIIKIEFDHKAESDGYGAAMTQTSFESQFVGAKINFDKNSFDLQNNIEKRIDNGRLIDGISGATMTSEAVIEMVNKGLLKYREYLDKK
jgi:Na+-transporting NADH:ubiquinone oxidoreductase subunit C